MIDSDGGSPKQHEDSYTFNGNFEKWFAKDEPIPRPKLEKYEANDRSGSGSRYKRFEAAKQSIQNQ